MSEFKVIETQEDFDKAIKSRLAQKDRELEEKFKDYKSPEDVTAMKAEFDKQLKEAQESLKQVQEKLKAHDSEVSELTKRAETAENSLLKNKIANEYKLPFELAGRLIGSNEEELKKDAESLSGILGTPKAAPPLHTGTQTSASSASVDAGMGELLSQINAQLAK